MDIFFRGILYTALILIAYATLKYILYVYVEINVANGAAAVCFIIPAMMLGGYYYRTRGQIANGLKKLQISLFLSVLQLLFGALIFFVAAQFTPELNDFLSSEAAPFIYGAFAFLICLCVPVSYLFFGLGVRQERKATERRIQKI